MSLFQVNGSTGCVSVHGDLDHSTLSKNFWECMSAQQCSQLASIGECCIDLGDVERVDSAGLAWLINAIRDGKKRNIEVRLRDLPEKLYKLAKISDVEDLLPVE